MWADMRSIQITVTLFLCLSMVVWLFWICPLFLILIAFLQQGGRSNTLLNPEEMLNDLSRKDCCGDWTYVCKTMRSLSELTQSHETTRKAWPDMDKSLQQKASKCFTIPKEPLMGNLCQFFIKTCLINAIVVLINGDRSVAS